MTCSCEVIILLFAFVTICGSHLTTFLLSDPSRLERLQRIVSKIQMESEMCDGELSQLESLLQTVSPVLILVQCWAPVMIVNSATHHNAHYRLSCQIICEIIRQIVIIFVPLCAIIRSNSCNCLSSLQDIRLLNAGKPAQHSAELDRELDKADKMIRLFFNDVQILKDGRHPQAEQMYRR